MRGVLIRPSLPIVRVGKVGRSTHDRALWNLIKLPIRRLGSIGLFLVANNGLVRGICTIAITARSDNFPYCLFRWPDIRSSSIELKMSVLRSP